MHQTPNQQAYYPVPPQNHYQSPLETKPLYETPIQGHQRATYPQELNSQSSIHQAPLTYRQPTQTTPSVDTQRVSKIQIPTNPRIASNLPSGYTKMDKGRSPAGATQTPAYVSVSMSNPKGHTTAMPEVRLLFQFLNFDYLASKVDIKCWPLLVGILSKFSLL